MQFMQSRRDFLASALCRPAPRGVLGARASLADEGPPETTTIRLRRDPVHLRRALVHGRGPAARGRASPTSAMCRAAGSAYADDRARRNRLRRFRAQQARRSPGCRRADHGAGGRACRLLRAVRARAHPHHQRPEGQAGRHPRSCGSGEHLYVAIMAARSGSTRTRISIGSRPALPRVVPMELFAAGKVDAFLGFPPEPQELRARKIGRVILNMTTDKPWSQYFCCMMFGNRDFVRDHPVATKRFLRAVLKANDICAAEPERAAQQLVDARLRAELRLRAADADRTAVRPAGASSTPRIRCGSMRCGCTRSA